MTHLVIQNSWTFRIHWKLRLFTKKICPKTRASVICHGSKAFASLTKYNSVTKYNRVTVLCMDHCEEERTDYPIDTNSYSWCPTDAVESETR